MGWSYRQRCWQYKQSRWLSLRSPSKFLITCLFWKLTKLETLLRVIHIDVLYFQFLSIQIFREGDIFRHDMLLCRNLLTDSHGYRFVLAGVLAEAAYFAEKLRVFTFRDSAYYWRRSPAARINCRKMSEHEWDEWMSEQRQKNVMF